MSVRAELVRLALRWLRRRSRNESVDETRRRIDRMAALGPKPPAHVETTAVDAGGVPADLVVAANARPGRHLLFLHGGAYRIGSRAAYRHFTWRLAAAARARVLAIEYRLAPEHPFPAALDDAVAAYRWLIGRNVDSRQMLVMGDSAGGGLGLALLLRLRDRGERLPAGAIALSPWTDLALTGASLATNADADPMLDVTYLPRFAADYLAGADPHLPYASPLYGDLAGLPPCLIQVGSDEILRDDAVRMTEKLRAAGSPVDLEIWPRMPHVWHLFVPLLPEARRAIARIGAFAERVLTPVESTTPPRP